MLYVLFHGETIGQKQRQQDVDIDHYSSENRRERENKNKIKVPFWGRVARYRYLAYMAFKKLKRRVTA